MAPPQSKTRIMPADAHHIPETTDATALVMTAAIARGLEIVMTEGEKGAGLEIAMIEAGETGTEMDVRFGTVRGVQAESVGLIDEVNANHRFLSHHIFS